MGINGFKIAAMIFLMSNLVGCKGAEGNRYILHFQINNGISESEPRYQPISGVTVWIHENKTNVITQEFKSDVNGMVEIVTSATKLTWSYGTEADPHRPDLARLIHTYIDYTFKNDQVFTVRQFINGNGLDLWGFGSLGNLFPAGGQGAWTFANPKKVTVSAIDPAASAVKFFPGGLPSSQIDQSDHSVGFNVCEFCEGPFWAISYTAENTPLQYSERASYGTDVRLNREFLWTPFVFADSYHVPVVRSLQLEIADQPIYQIDSTQPLKNQLPWAPGCLSRVNYTIRSEKSYCESAPIKIDDTMVKLNLDIDAPLITHIEYDKNINKFSWDYDSVQPELAILKVDAINTDLKPVDWKIIVPPGYTSLTIPNFPNVWSVRPRNIYLATFKSQNDFILNADGSDFKKSEFYPKPYCDSHWASEEHIDYPETTVEGVED